MIKVIYNKVCGRCVQSEPLTSGMVGQPIHFEYSHDFDGLAVTAVFTDGKNTVDVVNPGNECIIPHEVLTTVGAMVKVGIYAVKGDKLVIPTIYAHIGVVLKGADPSGDVSADPALPVWAQIQALMGNLNDLTTEAKDNLVSAINEAAQTGGGGGSTSIAMRVEGGYIQYSTDNGKTWVNLIAEADLKGAQGDPGKDGAPGKDGVAATIAVGTVSTSAAGSAAEVVNRGTSNAAVFDFKIPQGAPGKDGSHGKDGADGITPTIGDNGNWYLGSTDTGKPSRGVAGSAGQAGKDGKSAYQYAHEGGYTGTETEFSAKLAAEKFANPNALTFTGAVTGSYDGSAPLTVNIPEGGGGTGGGSSGTWELIGEVTSDGTGNSSGIYVPIDFTQYKEVFIEAWIAANVINRVLMSPSTAWYDGQILNTNSTDPKDFISIQNPHTQNVLAQTIIYNICGELKPFSSWCSGYKDGGKPVLQVSNARNTYLATSYSYIRMDTNNNGAVAEGNWLKVWGRK